MKVERLGWLGTRTEHIAAMKRFYAQTLGLQSVIDEPNFAAFRLPDGAFVELFGPEDAEHGHFTTGPVVGLVVRNIESAVEELKRAGVAIIHRGQVENGSAWAHFRAPDGNIYELVQPVRVAARARTVRAAKSLQQGS
ncbi:MAG TPA: VOC family protein [Candidatus Dormibacteraeota bacterium]|nr:VOC family protein [Candidatus Dormibacteraeota bacterium]